MSTPPYQPTVLGLPALSTPSLSFSSQHWTVRMKHFFLETTEMASLTTGETYVQLIICYSWLLGDEYWHEYWLFNHSLNLSSSQPVKSGCLVCKQKPSPRSSLVLLTWTCEKQDFSYFLLTIITYKPGSHNVCSAPPWKKQSTIHFFPIRPKPSQILAA